MAWRRRARLNSDASSSTNSTAPFLTGYLPRQRPPDATAINMSKASHVLPTPGFPAMSPRDLSTQIFSMSHANSGSGLAKRSAALSILKRLLSTGIIGSSFLLWTNTSGISMGACRNSSSMAFRSHPHPAQFVVTINECSIHSYSSFDHLVHDFLEADQFFVVIDSHGTS